MRRFLAVCVSAGLVWVFLLPVAVSAEATPACLRSVVSIGSRHAVPRCNSRALPSDFTIPRHPECTIRGTPGPDVLWGTAGNDTICGGGGDDRLFGVGGNDQLIGGWGDDGLFGGPGRDELTGLAGADLAKGGPAQDAINTGRGDDRLFGEAGADFLSSGAGNDRSYGGPGRDYMDDRSGNDRFFGGGGGDTIYALGAIDVVFAGPGNDGCVLTTDGRPGDRLYGGEGTEDTFNADPGDTWVAFEIGPTDACTIGC